MDSLMLGSLTLYRRLLNEHVWQPMRARPENKIRWESETERKRLPIFGACGCRHVSWLDGKLHCSASGTCESAFAGPICFHESTAPIHRTHRLLEEIDREPRHPESLARPRSNAAISDGVLFLVGFLRPFHSPFAKEYTALDTGGELLGGGTECAGFLAHDVSL